MDKKKLTYYVLLPGVILIWGYVIFSFYGTFAGNNNMNVSAPGIDTSFVTEPVKADTFSVLPDYRDPFLGSISSAEAKPVIIKNAAPVIKKNIENTWPRISYLGIIKNQTNNKQLALIKINGKTNKMQLNQQIEGILLCKVTKDSALVKFGKESRYIKR